MKPILSLTLALAALVASPALAAPELIAESDGRFSRPHDAVLSVDGALLYLSDLGNDRVAVLDAATLETVGEIGKDDLASPHDVAIDGAGRLLVADSGNDRIAVYALNGAKGTEIESWRGQISSPEGVQPMPDGSVLVTDTRGGALVVFRDGRPVRRIDDFGDGKGFRRPHDVILDGRGRVVLTDPGAHRLLVFDADLKPLKVIGGPPYDFNEPKYLDGDPKGRLYVADEYNDRIVILDAEHGIIEIFGAGRLNAPEGVAVRGDDIWVVDTHNHRVLKYRWSQ